MPQVSLYMDESMMEELRENAARAGVSLSKYVGDVLREHANKKRWPEGWFDLYGVITDEDDFEIPEDDYSYSEDDLVAFE